MWRFLVPYSRFKDWFSSSYFVVDMELVFHVMVWRVMGEGGGVAMVCFFLCCLCINGMYHCIVVWGGLRFWHHHHQSLF